MAELEGHGNFVSCICKLNAKTIASGSWDWTVRVWEDNEESCVLEGHTSNVNCICKIEEY